MIDINQYIQTPGKGIKDACALSVRILAISLMTYTVYYAFTLSIQRTMFVNIVLGIGLYIYFMRQYLNEASWEIDSDTDPAPVMSRGWLDRIICFPLAITAIFCSIYVHISFERLQSTAPLVGYTNADFVVGFIVILLVTDATRRAFGNAIPIVVVLTILYAMYGSLFPGLFHHSGLSLTDIPRFGAISLTGVYGQILTVGATWVAIFIMLAGLLKEYELMDYIISIADEMRTTLRSGVILLAVFASMGMGSLTGSAAANTATTGSFTIPMMKAQGVRDDFAGAVESIASTGGQILPPVMGTAAFLMADILNIRFLRVVEAGLIPAVLFYFSVAAAVYLFAFRHGWVNIEKTTRFNPSILLEGAHFLIPFAVLLYTLIEVGLTPLGAGKYTIVASIITAFGKSIFSNGINSDTIIRSTRQTIVGFERGSYEFVPLIGVLGAIGLIIRMVQVTGLAQKLSIQIVSIAAGIFLLVLVLTMLVALILGLGMPTPAAYLLVAILVAPAIVQFGVESITAHLFVFYFAMLSAITPPVAVATAIGSQIAGASFYRTVWQTMRMSFVIYLIPFMFIYNPELIIWEYPATAITFGIILIAVTGMTFSIVGHNGFKHLTVPYRVIYFVLGLVIPFAPIVTDHVFVPAVTSIVFLLVAFYSYRDPLFRSKTPL